MSQRRKSLSEKDIRTVLAIIESYREQNHYNWSEMNRHMGSLTIEEMIALNSKLKQWYHKNDVEDEYEDVDMDEYRDSYNDYISSYIY